MGGSCRLEAGELKEPEGGWGAVKLIGHERMQRVSASEEHWYQERESEW